MFADNKYAAGTGTILVRGDAKNPDGRLIPGSRVRVRIPVSDKYEAVVVPDSAVLSDQDRKIPARPRQGQHGAPPRHHAGQVAGRRHAGHSARTRRGEGRRSKARIENWEKEWVITVGLQRARINYPVQPLDADGQPIAATGVQ